MSMYYALKFLTKKARARTIDGSLRLRKQLANQIPARSMIDSLMLAEKHLKKIGGIQ